MSAMQEDDDGWRGEADTQPPLHYAEPWLPQRRIVVIPYEEWLSTELVDILDRPGLDGATVYLAGGDYAAYAPHRTYLEAPVYSGRYRVSRLRSGPPGARYRRVMDGYQMASAIDVSMTSAWFGRDPAVRDASVCDRAFRILAAILRNKFDPGITLYGTPARTGLALLQRCLPHDHERRKPIAEYPAITQDLAGMLRDHLWGQGRIEYVAPRVGTPGLFLPSLYVTDARWLYAACVRPLPTGEPVWDHDVPDYERDQTGFYRVRFQIPPNWQYPVGILPVRDNEAGETFWPYQPSNVWYESWCGHRELKLAVEHGWRVDIRERVLWRAQPVGADPARRWQERLIDARSHLPAGKTAVDDTALRLVAGALRNLLVAPVGSWYRESAVDEVEVPDSMRSSIPDNAYSLRPVYDSTHQAVMFWRYKVPVPLDRDLWAFSHPEWTVTTWSYARSKVANAAVRYCEEHNWRSLVAIRSDSLVTLAPPRWDDDGRVGTFRPKPVGGVRFGAVLPESEREWEETWREVLRANRSK